MTNEEEALPMACLVDAGEEDVASSEEAQRERIGRSVDRVGVEVLDWCIHEDGGALSRPAVPAGGGGVRPEALRRGAGVAAIRAGLEAQSDIAAIYSRAPGEGLMVVPTSEVDVVGASPACWMQGLVKALDEFFREEDREGSRRSVWVWLRRQGS